ncbi:MAG: hypothetical protein M1118_12605 [Chloroflexi bacterium]|nr:hypothetical protein [Chloroflexota bacterium]
MRDARFDRDTSGSGYRHQQIEQGKLVTLEPWFPAAVHALSDWCVATIRNLEAGAITSEDSSIVPDDVLRQYLSHANGVPSDRAHAFAAWSQYETAAPPDPQTDWIWGTALAHAAVDLGSDVNAFLVTGRMVAFRPAAAASYLDSLASALGSDRRPIVLAAMRQIIDRVRNLRGCQARGNQRERFAAALDIWWKEDRVANAWTTKPLDYFPIFFNEVWLLDAVRRHDRAMYLQMLSDTYNPLAVKEALENSEVVEDFDELLSLLVIAPFIRTTQNLDAHTGDAANAHPGESRRCLAAPLLLSIALEHAQRLVHLLAQYDTSDESLAENRKQLEQDLAERFEELMKVVLRREDSVTLASEWMLYLAREVAHKPWDATLPPEGIALHAAAHATVGYKNWEEVFCGQIHLSRGDVSGLDELLALIVLSYERDQAAAFPAEEAAPLPSAGAGAKVSQMRIFTELLDRGDPNLEIFRDKVPPSVCHAYTALLFVRSPTPNQAWHEIWLRLAEQRRRMHYRWYGQDRVVDYPSLFALYAGIAAFQWLTDDMAADIEAALHLWDRLYDAALSVVLRLGTSDLLWPRTTQWRRVVLVLLAFLPHGLRRCGDNMQRNDRLRVALSRLGGDDVLVVEGVALLSLNGVSNQELKDAVAHGVIALHEIVIRCEDTVGSRSRGSTVPYTHSALDACRAVLSAS